MFGKTLNAGQICLAPDYVMVHKDKKEEFINEAKNTIEGFFPDIKNNDDYTSIINEKHFDRINHLLDDAKEKGAHVEQINPSNEDFSQQEFYKIWIINHFTISTAFRTSLLNRKKPLICSYFSSSRTIITSNRF